MDLSEKWGINLHQSGKVACPRCRAKGEDSSGDNLMVYGEDSAGRHRGAFCWACEFTIPSEEWLEENGVVTEEYDIVGSAFNEQIHEQLKENSSLDPRGFRGIKKETATYFGVRHEYDTNTGEVNTQWYPCTIDPDDGEGSAPYLLSGYKRRMVPKAFGSPLGETGKDCHLFGQFRFLNRFGSRDVLIVGGELDQLSAFQMLSEYQASRGFDPVPVVSSTIGESGAYKQVVAQYEWFNRFERIIICMDNDKAGREAAEKIAQALPKHKAFIMNLSLKDPNAYIWDQEKGVAIDKSREFINLFYKAVPYTPNGIVGSGSLLDMMRESVRVPKIPLPPFMHKVQRMMAGGIPLGRIVNLGSASGTGKSTIVDECVYYWVFNSPHKVGVVSLESDAAEYGIKMISRHIGRKLDLIEDIDEKIAVFDSPEIEAASKVLFFNQDGSHRWHLLDERDGGLDDLKEKVMQLVVACDCKVIILDPLQDILDGMSNEEQAVFMRWQKGMTKSHKVTFININHVRKSGQGGKQNSTGADLYEEDFQGSSAIFKSGACNLLFMRDKEAESDILRNVTRMKMTKCRWTGNTSPKAGEYYYDNPTHTIHDLHDYLEKNPQAKHEYEIALAMLEEAEG